MLARSIPFLPPNATAPAELKFFFATTRFEPMTSGFFATCKKLKMNQVGFEPVTSRMIVVECNHQTNEG